MVQEDAGAGGGGVREEELREGCLEVALQGAPQGAGAVALLVAQRRELFACRRGDLQPIAELRGAGNQPLQLQVQDALDVAPLQCAEAYHLVDAV